MATIEKSYDVVIKVVYPHLTKTIPTNDITKITTNTLFKYEPQKALETKFGQVTSEVEVEEVISVQEQIKNKMNEVVEQFDKIEELIDNRMKNKSLDYDVQDQENTSLVEAQESIFGEATGIITYDQYSQSLKLIRQVQQELARRAQEVSDVA